MIFNQKDNFEMVSKKSAARVDASGWRIDF